MDLSGQIVLVTGADGGIGRALVEELAKRDVRVLAGMHDPGNFMPVGQRGAREVRRSAWSSHQARRSRLASRS
jgi:NAD(P)-dependent dehydrogenase (short-subunit alcohol dehydrogenase family)